MLHDPLLQDRYPGTHPNANEARKQPDRSPFAIVFGDQDYQHNTHLRKPTTDRFRHHKDLDEQEQDTIAAAQKRAEMQLVPPKSNFRSEGGAGVLERGECERRGLDPHFLRPHRLMLHINSLPYATPFISFQVDSLLLVKGNRHSTGNVGLLHLIFFRQVLEVLLP